MFLPFFLFLFLKRRKECWGQVIVTSNKKIERNSHSMFYGKIAVDSLVKKVFLVLEFDQEEAKLSVW